MGRVRKEEEMVQSVMMTGVCTWMVFYWINPTVSNKRVEVNLLWGLYLH